MLEEDRQQTFYFEQLAAYLVAVCGLAAQHLEGLQQVGVTRRHARHHLQEQGSQVWIVIVVRKVLVEGNFFLLKRDTESMYKCLPTQRNQSMKGGGGSQQKLGCRYLL
jgi:hypothetical protein